MIDREKVIKSLEYNITRAEFADLDWIDCVYVQMLRDALELLKADQLEMIRQRDRIESLERIVDHLEQTIK